MSPPISFPGVYTHKASPAVPPITGVATAITAFIGRALRGPLNQPVSVRSFAEFTSLFGGLWPSAPMSYAVEQFFRHGGSHAIIVRVFNGTSGDGEPITDSQVMPFSSAAIANREGIHALESVDLFNLLCIPPLASVADAPPAGAGPSWPDLDNASWAAAAGYCQRRRAILLLDPPASWTVGGGVAGTAEAGATVLRSIIGSEAACNTAVYFPRVKMADPMNANQPAVFASSGAVAGIIARIDAKRGVWKAPAGFEASFTGVTGFSYGLTSRENGPLNALGVNCLRSFPGRGNMVWGARTLASSDPVGREWKYLQLRRLALYIEESLHRGCSWAASEPNGEPLWSRLRQSVSAFMDGLFRQGAFQGDSSREAFFVRCDSQTTSRAAIRQGVVKVLAGFAAHKPGEFVVLEIQGKARLP